MKTQVIDRERQSPPDRNAKASEAPWSTKEHVIQDSDGDTIAVAVREADARLMAAAPRLAAILWLQLDSGLIDPHFRKDAEAALRDAGQQLPVEGGANGSK